MPSPITPPATPRPAKKVRFLDSPKDVDIYNPIIEKYEALNAQLRSKIQDYEIALLKMQLREKDREFEAILQGPKNGDPRNTVKELVLRIGRQEKQIKGLNAAVKMWKGYAVEAKSMLERTYSDMTRVGLVPAH